MEKKWQIKMHALYYTTKITVYLSVTRWPIVSSLGLSCDTQSFMQTSLWQMNDVDLATVLHTGKFLIKIGESLVLTL
jgi:hypothetical protein